MKVMITNTVTVRNYSIRKEQILFYKTRVFFSLYSFPTLSIKNLGSPNPTRAISI